MKLFFRAFLLTLIVVASFSNSYAGSTKRTVDDDFNEDTPGAKRVKLSDSTTPTGSKQTKGAPKPESSNSSYVVCSILRFSPPEYQLKFPRYVFDIQNWGLIQSYDFFFNDRDRQPKTSAFLSMNPLKLKLLWAWVSADPFHALPGSLEGYVSKGSLVSYAPQKYFTLNEVHEAAEAIVKSALHDRVARMMALILIETSDDVEKIQSPVFALGNTRRGNELKYRFVSNAIERASSRELELSKVFRGALPVVGERVKESQNSSPKLENQILKYRSRKDRFSMHFLKIFQSTLVDGNRLKLCNFTRSRVIFDICLSLYNRMKEDYELDEHYGNVSPHAANIRIGLMRLVGANRLHPSLQSHVNLLLCRCMNKGLVRNNFSSIFSFRLRFYESQFITLWDRVAVSLVCGKYLYKPKQRLGVEYVNAAFAIFRRELHRIASSFCQMSEEVFGMYMRTCRETERLGVWGSIESNRKLNTMQALMHANFEASVGRMFSEFNSGFLGSILLPFKFIAPRLYNAYLADKSLPPYCLWGSRSLVSPSEGFDPIERVIFPYIFGADFYNGIIQNYQHDRRIVAKAKLLQADFQDQLHHTLKEYQDIHQDETLPKKYVFRAFIKEAAYFYHCWSRGKLTTEYRSRLHLYTVFVKVVAEHHGTHPKDRIKAQMLLKIMSGKRKMTFQEATKLLGSVTQVMNTASYKGH